MKNINLTNKNEIRSQIIKDRAFGLASFEMSHFTLFSNLFKLLMSFDLAGKNIGLFHSMRGEPDLLSYFIDKSEEYRFNILLPYTSYGNNMHYVKYDKGDKLIKSDFGFFEPRQQFSENDNKNNEKGVGSNIIPDILIVPSVAIDLLGNRIGFGKGFFDNYLNKNMPLGDKKPMYNIVGVCFHKYLFEYLPNNIYDRKMNYIVTEKIILNI